MSEIVKEIINKIFKIDKAFSVKLWDNEVVKFGTNPKFCLVFNTKESFKKIIKQNSIKAFTEEFVSGNFDIEGDIYEAIRIKYSIKKLSLGEKLKIFSLLSRL